MRNGDKKIHALLVEDNPGDAELVRLSLLRAAPGFELDCADALGEALGRLAVRSYDVMLLDLSLPDSSGLDTVIRALEKAPDLPVVVLTGADDEMLGTESVRLGAEDYLIKGKIDSKLLCRAIRYAMERKRANTLLRKARDELEQRVRERTADLEHALVALHEEFDERTRLEQEVLAVSEMERQRIGRDLHDTMGAQLTGLSFLAKALEHVLAKQQRPEAEDVAKMRVLTNEAIVQCRALAGELQPLEIGEAGLGKAVEEMARNMERIFCIPCELDLPQDRLTLSTHVAVNVYNIAREAITNAMKHAQADHLWVSLARAGDGLALRVRDNGIGLPEDYRDRKGLGTRIMEYRARIIGASLDIRRLPEGGTLVECLLGGARGQADAAASRKPASGASATKGRI